MYRSLACRVSVTFNFLKLLSVQLDESLSQDEYILVVIRDTDSTSEMIRRVKPLTNVKVELFPAAQYRYPYQTASVTFNFLKLLSVQSDESLSQDEYILVVIRNTDSTSEMIRRVKPLTNVKVELFPAAQYRYPYQTASVTFNFLKLLSVQLDESLSQDEYILVVIRNTDSTSEMIRRVKPLTNVKVELFPAAQYRYPYQTAIGVFFFL